MSMYGKQLQLTHRISEKEFGQLLREKTFVDYFNVFLSLPVFGQGVIVRHVDCEFEFEPPIIRTKQRIQKRKLRKWLMEERVPYFLDTELYLEYVLCKLLLETRVTLTRSSHKIDYDEVYQHNDKCFLLECMGHVTGMRHFRESLRGTPGERLVNFWMDVEGLHRVETEDSRGQWAAIRHMQIKYFYQDKDGGDYSNIDAELTEILRDGPVGLAGGNLLGLVGDSSHLMTNHDNSATSAAFDSILKELKAVQSIVVTMLRSYWVHRFILNCRIGSDRQLRVDLPNGIHTMSDMEVLQTVKDIDTAIKLIEKTSGRDTENRRRRAEVSWQAMFPSFSLSDSTFADEDNVILASDNQEKLVQTQLGPDMDENLRCLYQKKAQKSPLEKFDEEVKAHLKKQEALAILQAKKEKEETERLAAARKARWKRTPRAGKRQGMRRMLNEVDEEENEDDWDDRLQDLDDAPTTAQICLFRDLLSRLQTRRGTFSSAAGESLPGLPLPLPKPVPVSVPRKVDNPKLRKLRSKITKLPPIDRKDVTRFPAYREGLANHLLANSTPWAGKQARVRPSQFKKVASEKFRLTEKKLVCGLAADMIGGQSFVAYLKKNQSDRLVVIYEFWTQAELYLQYKRGPCDNVHSLLTMRKAILLIMQFLNESEVAVALSPPVCERLKHLLPDGDGDDLLRDVQDVLSQELAEDLKSFQTGEIESFYKHVVTKRKVDPNRPVSSTEGPLAHSQNKRQTPDASAEDRIRSDQRQTDKALCLTLDVCNLDTEGLPVDKINFKDLQHNKSDMYGSISVDTVQIVRRPDVIAEECRQKRLAEMRRLQKLWEAELVKRQKDSHLKDDDDEQEDIPSYMKSFRKNGVLIKRPSRPRTFAEVFRDEIHTEFFLRFLQWHASETPLQLVLAVEHLKTIKDVKLRQMKTAQVIRRYFSETHGKGVEALECDAEVVKEIPYMDKVTFPMLQSAASCVARRLEEKWFPKYISTFPSLAVGSISPTKRREPGGGGGGPRSWAKEATRLRWVSFIRVVIRFKQAVKNPDLLGLFGVFLREEATREVNRQKNNPNNSYTQGMPVKKLIHSRFIDVTKLSNDLRFIIEVDRYCEQCDDMQFAGMAGTFSRADEASLESKVKMLVDCFLNSEVPPKLQINISHEIAGNIMENVSAGVRGRGLFHEAFIAIFPTVLYLWRNMTAVEVGGEYNTYFVFYGISRFQKIRIYQTFARRTASRVEKKREADYPDFLNVKTEDIKKVHTYSTHDDETVRILFSVTNGIRWMIPRFRSRWSNESCDDDDDVAMDEESAAIALPISFQMSQRRNRRVSSMVSDIPSGLLADARGNKGSDGQKTHERRRSSVVQPPQQRQRRRSSLAIQAKIKNTPRRVGLTPHMFVQSVRGDIEEKSGSESDSTGSLV